MIQRSTHSLVRQPIAVRISGDPVAANNGIFYFHTDHLGSTSVMTKHSDGYIVTGSMARYTPFGDWRTEPSADLTDRGYTGHMSNNTGSNDLGMIYMNARFYVPSLNRFASADTIIPDPMNPQSLNRYTYSLNSPLNFSDPSGHIACDVLGTEKCVQDANGNPAAQYIDPPKFGDEGWASGNLIVSGKVFYVNSPSEQIKSILANYINDPNVPEEFRKSAQATYNKLYVEDQADAVFPDAFIIGFSADTGGWFPSYTAGAEDLLFFETGEVAAFAYDGTGQGHGLSADIGAYAGFVWNLECVDCYKGDFKVLAIDLGLVSSYEIDVFWAPGGETWGVAGAPSAGLAASVTLYETNYIRLDEPQ